MIKTVLEKGLVVYSFPPTFKNEFVSYNIITLQYKSEVLIIDTAFRRHFNQIVDDLNSQNLTITHAITTHFHKDHIGGLIRLPNATTYASKNCHITLKKVFKQDDYSAYIPTHKVEDNTIIYFGGFKIEMIVNEGHSIDGLLVVINDKFIQAGDDILFTEDQIPLLPFASDDNIKAHIKSLETIASKVTNSILVPSHGQIINNDQFILNDIENRIKYLQHKLQNEHLTSEQFEVETGIHFLGYPWYQGNI